MFTKGHQYGVRFSATNQPKKNGRKPSLYKKLKALTGETVGFELEKEDYYNIIRYLMEQPLSSLEKLIKGENGKVAKDVPIWVINIITAIQADCKFGRMSTLDSLFDRIFGKPDQNISSEVNATVETLPQMKVEDLTEEQKQVLFSVGLKVLNDKGE